MHRQRNGNKKHQQKRYIIFLKWIILFNKKNTEIKFGHNTNQIIVIE